MAKRRQQNQPDSPVRSARMPADHAGVLLAALAMFLGGWAGLGYLVVTSPPRLGAELWIFFIMLHLAITGTVLPIVRYLNVRFTRVSAEPPAGGVIVRQSIWIGLYVVILAWLQLLRSLSLPIGFFLGLVFVVLEGFLRTREINANS